MSLDEARGLLYVPVGTPSNDCTAATASARACSARRIVCLDAATGKRKWHYQLVHHGIWDYDPPSPPNLVTITPDGKRVDAVVQLTKQGFAFVFDRVTGGRSGRSRSDPWRRATYQAKQAWPTQPFPTKPPAFTEQGVTLDDAFDLTPELKQEAQAAMQKYRIGPLFTPPSLEGTIMRPGSIGGSNWGGGAFDARDRVPDPRRRPTSRRLRASGSRIARPAIRARRRWTRSWSATSQGRRSSCRRIAASHHSPCRS